jgi:hypothetical protein
LRTIGLSQDSGFSKYHRVLNSLDWSAKRGSAIFLKILLKMVSQERPVILIDETLERRKGKRIQSKGYYRDAVRSSRSCVVKTTGLKWLVMAFSFHFSFARRAFALPFFTVLEPSEKSTKKKGKRHKTSIDWSTQMVKQLVRWAPAISFILVGDGGFACAKLAWTCLKNNIALVSRLKMNACIYAVHEEAPPGKWSDKAIARTTPILMALYSMVCLIGHRLNEKASILAEKAAWYDKEKATFSDLLKAVRVMLWKDNLQEGVFRHFLENSTRG